MEEPIFTFAIVNWNTRELLDRCLSSIDEYAATFSYEVLVADNGSHDGSVEMVEKKYPKTVLVQNGVNLGFAAGHLPLFERSRGRYHVLVNSDVELTANCLETVVARLEKEQAIGVLGCRILGSDGHIQPSCRTFPNLWTQAIEASGINRLFPRSPLLNRYKMGGFDHRSSREVDQVMGSFFVIRKELLERVGYLDTGFFMYYEEVDYCLRCKAAGYQVFYEAEAMVCHVGGGSASKVKVLTIRRTMRSMRRYFAKHVGWWSYLLLVPIVSLDLVTHAGFALIRRRHFLETVRAYSLGLWDLVTLKRADW